MLKEDFKLAGWLKRIFHQAMSQKPQ